MAGEEATPHLQTDDAGHQRRMDALRALAGAQAPARETSGARRAHPRGRRRLVGVVSALLVVAAIAATVTAWLVQTSRGIGFQPDPWPVSLAGTDIGCVGDVSWSPDGQRIAVSGQSGSCGPSDTAPVASAVILDANTGRIERRTDVSTEVTRAAYSESLRSDPTIGPQLGIALYGVTWSPDSTRLAIHVGGPWPTPGRSSDQWGYWTGLYLVSAASTTSGRLYQGSPGPPGYNAGTGQSSNVPNVVARLDLQTGTFDTLTVPQALAYRWTADGQLTPTQPLSASAQSAPVIPTPGAVGNPSGGKTFSVWQGAVVVPMDAPCGAPVFQVLAGAIPWSPDGRYLITSFGLLTHARLTFTAPPAPTPTLLTGEQPVPCSAQPAFDVSQLARVAVRDPGMESALQLLVGSGGSAQGGPGTLFLWWSPNGNAVAAEVESGRPYAPPMTIAIFSCKAGALVKTLTPAQIGFKEASGPGPSGLTLAWSADGARLALADQRDSQVIYILGPHSLGE